MPGSKKAKILGIRMKPETAAAVKAEALRRGVSVSTLFDELWAMYLASEKAQHAG